MKSRLTLTAVLLATLGACSADNPEDTPIGPGPDAGVPEGDVVLKVNPVDVSTPWPSVPVTGTGPAKGTVVYKVGGQEDVARLGATGEFCIDVDINPGDNEIVLEAISREGERSPAEVLNVRREGDPPTIEPIDDTQITLGDRTPGARFLASRDTGWTFDEVVYLEEGEFPELVDGNRTKTVKFFGNGIADNGEAIAFSLKERMAVFAFEVVAPPAGDETCGPEGFRIWLSDEIQPELDLDGISWVKVQEIDIDTHVAEGTTYELDASVPGFNARHVAIEMTDSSCAGILSADLSYGLNELRVIAAEEGDIEVPYDGAPSCATGGF